MEQLLGVVSGYVPSIELLSELLSDLDVFCALATVASSSPLPYCRPTLAEAGTGDTIIKGSFSAGHAQKDTHSFNFFWQERGIRVWRRARACSSPTTWSCGAGRARWCC